MEPKQFTVAIVNKNHWTNIYKRICGPMPSDQEYVDSMINFIMNDEDFKEPGAIVDDKIIIWIPEFYGEVSDDSFTDILNYLVLADMDNFGACIRQLDETGEYEFGKEEPDF